ncbi:MAG: hypothetical protein WDN44_09935 [Sphingomonas sp.]
MLRRIVLVSAALLLAAAAIAVGRDHSAWPVLLGALLLFAGCVFERFHYRGAEPVAGPWQATAERFRDEASGRLVTVWFNPATGDRRYVETGEAPPRG